MVCYPCPSGSDEAMSPIVQSKPDKELTDNDVDDDDDEDEEDDDDDDDDD